MSPKGSIATVLAPAVRRKADCPYHSTCMLLLSCVMARPRFARARLTEALVACRMLEDPLPTGGMAARGARIERRLVGVLVAPAPQRRRGGGDQAGEDRE